MRPHYVDKLWGGARIATLPAKRARGHAPTSHTTGESWEVSDLPEGQSVVDDGDFAAAFAGRTLGDLVTEFSASLVGHGRTRFPLLVKIIDAREDLSVQVHPGAAYASAHPGTFSKDEAWLVLDAEPGARALHGFVEGVDERSFRAAIVENRADALLRSVPVVPGDVLHIGPGTVHAVGRGLMLLEVQEPSDTTFRVWDYGRLQDGKPRALHVEQALAVARFGAQPPAVHAHHDVNEHTLNRLLIHTPTYEMRLLRALPQQPLRFVQDGRSPIVLFTLAGGGRLVQNGRALDLVQGGSVILPAVTDDVIVHARAPGTVFIAMSA
jgi:mannose-6-phosphate isomerase